jgi:hypothetical protein
MNFFIRFPKTTNFIKLIFGMYVGNKICDKIYDNQKQCSDIKEELLRPSHIVTKLRNKDGRFINILAESHFKSDLETEECNKLIFNDNVKNILIECYKPDMFSTFMCICSYIVFELYIRKQNLKMTNKNESSVYVAKQSNKICHNLELNSYGGLTDNLLILSHTIFDLAPFILFAKYNVAIKIMSVTFSYNLLTILLEYISDYKTKSFFSKLFLIKRMVYRRDYIMANNIIKYMNENKDKDDIPLCIFGSLHNEGIIYYLEQNGYEIVGNPRIF